MKILSRRCRLKRHNKDNDNDNGNISNDNGLIIFDDTI